MRLKSALLIILLLICIHLQAQRPGSDVIRTDKGDLLIQPILHGTLMLQWDNKTIYIDPYGGQKAFQGLPSPDLILITDIHGDHFNQETLKELGAKGATYIVPKAVMDRMDGLSMRKIVVLSNGGSSRFHDIEIEAIPMYNLPEDETSRHTKGRGNGYILTLGGKRVYISGDTEDIPEMRNLKNIDVAFVCMNLPFTMDINQAASAVIDFKPEIMYPYHYRGRGGLADVEAFKKLVAEGYEDTEVRLRNWYPEY